MVSLWPWRKDDTSPASFEKALSLLSDNISKSQVKLDALRQNSRRLGLLWLLYSVFAYILCAAILALVVGWKNWNSVHYTAIAGSPLVIYLIKAGITGYYAYRIDTVSKRLEGYQAERTKTIEKLKAATKYNSTQQLLEKYGGAAPSPNSSPASNRKSKGPGKPGPRVVSNTIQRTGLGPPPTANIPRHINASPPTTPDARAAEIALATPPIPIHLAEPKAPTVPTGAAEFAPNAFNGPPSRAHSSSVSSQGGNWYDRILDAILGEDETMAKNRLALICDNCKVVLGQAPPGVRRLEDVGKWKCGACGAWNGVEDEGKKIVKQMQQQAKMEVHDHQSVEKDDPIGLSSGGDGDDEMQTEDYDFDEEEETEDAEEVEEADEIPAVATKPRKGKARTSRKK